MKTMLKTLIGIRLRALFTGGMGNGKKKMSAVGSIVLVCALVLLFALFFISIAGSLAIVFVPRGLHVPYFAIFNILTFGMVFVLSIFETKSELFECRDNELLLSLPIRPGDIVLSRSITVILLNMGEALLVSIPAVIMYVVMGGFWWYVPSAIIVSLIISLVATALASAVGYVVALISARLKNNALISVALTLVFLGLYFFGYNALLDGLTSLESDPDMATEALTEAFASIAFIGRISLAYPLELTIFVVVSATICCLTWYLISKNYFRMISYKAPDSAKKYVHSELKAGSMLFALFKKEMLSFLSSSAYILNGGMGALFQILLAVMLFGSSGDLLLVFTEFGMAADPGFIAVMVTALMFGCSSMVTISASAVSLEGKNYWILKSSPIPTSAIILMKLSTHLAISLPVSIISSVIVLIPMGLDPLWWLFVLLVPALGSVIFAMLGLILNIAMPKLIFDNPVQVVKQSMPVFILSLGGIILTIALGYGSLVACFAFGSAFTALVFSAITVFLFLVVYLILTGPSAKKLETIS